MEGEEHFRISLVYADSGALLSRNQSSAIVVILADQRAIGAVSISSNTSVVMIGKPFAGYDGSSAVELIRTQGWFGTFSVFWQIEGQSVDLFVQSQGYVTFNELQNTAAVNLEV